jgi:hypothetical protein
VKYSYADLPFLTPSEQKTFTSIMNRLRARRYAAVGAIAPWDRPEFGERVHPVPRRSGAIARILRMARAS